MTVEPPTLVLELELAGRGQGWTDRTHDLMRKPAAMIRTGIRRTGPQDLVASTSVAEFTLRDAMTPTGRPYTPGDQAADGFRVDTGIRITLDKGDGTERILFVGHVVRLSPTVGESLRHFTAVMAADYIDRLARMGPPDLDIAATGMSIADAVETLIENLDVTPRSMRIIE